MPRGRSPWLQKCFGACVRLSGLGSAVCLIYSCERISMCADFTILLLTSSFMHEGAGPPTRDHTGILRVTVWFTLEDPRLQRNNASGDDAFK